MTPLYKFYKYAQIPRFDSARSDCVRSAYVSVQIGQLFTHRGKSSAEQETQNNRLLRDQVSGQQAIPARASSRRNRLLQEHKSKFKASSLRKSVCKFAFK